MKLTRWKLVYIFLSIFLIFQTNMVLANNIVVPNEWYRYQGASDSDKKGNDCGPACVAMAIQFIKNTFVPIRDIRNYIGPNTATSEQLKNSLQHWGISYTHLSAGSQNVIDAVNNRKHIVICPVEMLCFSPGLDIDSESDDPALHYDRYCSFTEEHQGHFIVVKGISDDGNWIIVYDPGVWRSYPDPKYWYSNGEPKGKERYYKLSEFSNAINSRGIEILAEPHPIITSPLKITPAPPYYVGDTINTEFSITNKGATSINFSVLTVGGRDPDNYVSDFNHRQNIILEPSEPYNYQGTLTLNKVGDYHFFCTYQTPDGNWNTNVDLGSGLADEDRTKEVVVIEREAEKEVVYVAEQSNDRIQKFTSEGKFIKKWGKGGSGDGDFNLPRGIAIDSQGNVYVADSNNCCIQKFTSEGKFITKWGKRGSGDGEFDCPTGIAIDSQGNVYVTDSYNHRIQKFTSEGKFITKWGDLGSSSGMFRSPQGIAIDSEGNIYVADTDNYQIQKFTSEGKFITQWGKEGIGDGELDKPHDIAIDSQGNVYVADWNNARIQKFTSEGKFITQWGKEGSGDSEFDCPTGIAISGIYETEELKEKEEEKLPIASDISEELYIEWEKTFGGSADDWANSIIQTTDGGYAVAGYTGSKGAGGFDFWVIKLDEQGKMIWDRTYGGSNHDFATSLIQTTDCGYVIAGITESKGAGKKDFWVIKLDEQGKMIWDRTYGGSAEDLTSSLIQTTDGGYAVAGYTGSKGAGGFDFWVIKLDEQGKMIWDRTYGENSTDWAYSLIQTTDGGYAVAGWTESKDAGKNDALIIKLDHQGNKIWDKVYGGEEDDYAISLIQTSDSGYAVAGSTESKGAGKADIWVIKLNSKSIEALEEKITDMEAVEDKIEKEKLLIDSSLYHIESNKPIVSGNIFVVIPVNVSGPADELALILANPKGETDIKFISKRALIDNFETVKLHMGNAPLSEGPYILTVKTVTPEKIIYKKELWFTLPDVSIADAEFTYKITHLGGAYGYAGYYFLEMISLTLINNGDLPAKRDTNARALITLDGKPENMTLLARRPPSISPYKVDFYPPTYITNGKNKISDYNLHVADAMYGLKKGNYFVTITIPLIGGETVTLKKALTIE